MLRATVKSLLSRKLRLVLSGVAVVLGVMAVSGALIVGETLSSSFDQLFRTTTANVDVQVSGRTNVTSNTNGEPISEPVPADVLARVEAVPGVERAYAEVSGEGARVVGRDGKVITSNGPPTLGTAWGGDLSMIELREGRGPDAPGEVAIDAGLAERGGFRVGEPIEVLTLEPKRTFTLVGVFGYTGDRDSLGGEMTVMFSTPDAQQLILGAPGSYSAITATAADGVDQEQLRQAVAAAVGGDYTVRTGEEVAAAQASDVGEFVDVVRQVLLGFAGVALFVGIFLILNTFSILVAQRTGELALLRSMGASRGQVIGSVLLEAVIIGLVASTIGLAAGIGVAAGLKQLMQSFSNATFPGAWLVIPPSAIIASYVVGILVTVVAAVLPALRASRIAPVEAMREAKTNTRPSVVLSIIGGVLTAGGAAAVAWALTRSDFTSGVGYTLLGGVVAAFVGVAMLTPVLCGPVVSVLGRFMEFTTAGKLGRLNSARNPRRTAITAAALMIGIALVAGVSVIASSLTSSIEKSVETELNAEFLIGSMNSGGSLPATFDPSVIDEAAATPGVAVAVGVRFDAVMMHGDDAFAIAGDAAALADVLRLRTVDGEMRTLGAGELIVDSEWAAERGTPVGSQVAITTQRGGEQSFTVVGTYQPNELASEPILSDVDSAAGFRSAQFNQGFVRLEPGADTAAVRARLDALVADNPEVAVLDQSALVEQAASSVDTVVIMLYVLLGLALLIAVLGIVNTLALSVLERTRELGLVRAIGMRRGQVVQMVTVESVTIAMFGALLGVVVGGLLGTAVVRSLEDEGFSTIAIPWASFAGFVVLAVVIGLVAAIVPAIRASRTNVLAAIAYE